MKPAGDLAAQRVSQERLARENRERSRAPFAAASALLIAALLLGGSSKDYVPGLLVLRPLAVITLAIGLYSLRASDWARFKAPLGFMAAMSGLIAMHLVPLPPAVWMALPGRELAIAAGEAAGIEQPWRPIALVPYRGWNALFASLVPTAIAVCAVQLDRDQHRALIFMILGGALISAIWGAVQSVSGFAPSTFFYGPPRVEAPNGFFANRNHMAAALVASLPLLALAASRAKPPSRVFAIIGGAALGAFCLMMALTTGSRAGLVFALIALAASALIWRARPVRSAARIKTRQRQPWAPYALAAFGVVTLAVFAVLLTQTTGFERLLSAGSGEVEEHRLTVWRTIVEFAPTYGPLGSGIGSFVEVFKVHEPSAMLGQSYWNHAHNDWLEWALEGGVPAALLMGLAVAGWAVRAFALVRNSHRGRIDIQLGLTGAMILLILGGWSVVDYPLRTPALASLAALCAVWMAMPQLSARRSAETPLEGFAATQPPTQL